MKKLTLAVIACFLNLAVLFAQNPVDSVSYQKRNLKFEEVNLVSGYYQQDGNKSAVTGGIGTEKLTDVSNALEIRLSKLDTKNRKHNFQAEIGIDSYTSASSDNIEISAKSSASRQDVRIYPSVSYTVESADKQQSIGGNLSFSTEYDYKSYGFGGNFSQKSKDKSRELAIKANVFLDTWDVILPYELRPSGYGSGSQRDRLPIDHKPRNSFNTSFALTQIINRNLQIGLMLEPTYQEGLLATKYQRVYFSDGTAKPENLPDTRWKIPIGFRLNYFAGETFVFRSFYRYYQDAWGLKAHTISLEMPIKISAFFSISPMYRFYSQNSINYFAGYGLNNANQEFFTSDYDLSQFNSHYFGAGLRISPPKGVFNIDHFSMLELRYGYYDRGSTGLSAHFVGINLKFK